MAEQRASDPARVLVEPLEQGVLDGVRELEGEPHRVRVDLGILPVFLDERPLLGLAGLVDWRACGRLSRILREGLFSGALGELLLTPGDRRLPVDRLVLVGLGPRAEFDGARLRQAAQAVVSTAVGLRADGVLIALPSEGIERRVAEDLFAALISAVEAALTPPDEGPQAERSPSAAPQAERSPDPASTASTSEQGEEGSEEGASEEPVAPDQDPELPELPELPPGGPPPEAPSGPAPADAAEEPEVPPEDPPEPSAREGADLEAGCAGWAPGRWWVVADEQVVARLRRVLSGPPRPARGGPGLHT
ncbi:hypothetical protein G6O69_30450 [Pseudenhygromyxa sp. WMMC2535]|uniref:M17 family peptidase N-terminal domain-containing protein n=1 Tax=Pseudenhygromyxa sp. WMMC2535 TaxID=2712867 RepID=UPI001594E7BA|nr:hypothetical protein [Pseudenhygromyxa sp. WMMC2535]